MKYLLAQIFIASAVFTNTASLGPYRYAEDICSLRKTSLAGDEFRYTYTVDCRNKGLTVIPRFRSPERVQELYLTGNFIKKISSFAFERMIFLETLFIDHCNIDEIEENAFTNLHLLETLVLNDNHLRYLPDSLISGLGNLRYLTLHNNNLREFQKEVLENKNIDLLLLSLGNNKLSCDCSVYWLWNELNKEANLLPSDGLGLNDGDNFPPVTCFDSTKETFVKLKGFSMKKCPEEDKQDFSYGQDIKQFITANQRYLEKLEHGKKGRLIFQTDRSNPKKDKKIITAETVKSDAITIQEKEQMSFIQEHAGVLLILQMPICAMIAGIIIFVCLGHMRVKMKKDLESKFTIDKDIAAADISNKAEFESFLLNSNDDDIGSKQWYQTAEGFFKGKKEKMAMKINASLCELFEAASSNIYVQPNTEHAPKLQSTSQHIYEDPVDCRSFSRNSLAENIYENISDNIYETISDIGIPQKDDKQPASKGDDENDYLSLEKKSVRNRSAESLSSISKSSSSSLDESCASGSYESVYSEEQSATRKACKFEGERKEATLTITPDSTPCCTVSEVINHQAADNIKKASVTVRHEQSDIKCGIGRSYGQLSLIMEPTQQTSAMQNIPAACEVEGEGKEVTLTITPDSTPSCTVPEVINHQAADNIKKASVTVRHEQSDIKCGIGRSNGHVSLMMEPTQQTSAMQNIPADSTPSCTVSEVINHQAADNIKKASVTVRHEQSDIKCGIGRSYGHVSLMMKPTQHSSTMQNISAGCEFEEEEENEVTLKLTPGSTPCCTVSEVINHQAADNIKKASVTVRHEQSDIKCGIGRSYGHVSLMMEPTQQTSVMQSISTGCEFEEEEENEVTLKLTPASDIHVEQSEVALKVSSVSTPSCTVSEVTNHQAADNIKKASVTVRHEQSDIKCGIGRSYGHVSLMMDPTQQTSAMQNIPAASKFEEEGNEVTVKLTSDSTPSCTVSEVINHQAADNIKKASVTVRHEQSDIKCGIGRSYGHVSLMIEPTQQPSAMQNISAACEAEEGEEGENEVTLRFIPESAVHDKTAALRKQISGKIRNKSSLTARHEQSEIEVALGRSTGHLSLLMEPLDQPSFVVQDTECHDSLPCSTVLEANQAAQKIKSKASIAIAHEQSDIQFGLGRSVGHLSLLIEPIEQPSLNEQQTQTDGGEAKVLNLAERASQKAREEYLAELSVAVKNSMKNRTEKLKALGETQGPLNETSVQVCDNGKKRSNHVIINIGDYGTCSEFGGQKEANIESGVGNQANIKSGAPEQSNIESGARDQANIKSLAQKKASIVIDIGDNDASIETGVQKEGNSRSGVRNQAKIVLGAPKQANIKSGAPKPAKIVSGAPKEANVESGALKQTNIEPGAQYQAKTESGAPKQATIESRVQTQADSGSRVQTQATIESRVQTQAVIRSETQNDTNIVRMEEGQSNNDIPRSFSSKLRFFRSLA